MKVEFEFSAADLAEVSTRSSNRSRVVRDWRWEGQMTWAVLVGIVVYAVTPGHPPGRAMFATFVGLLLVLYLRRQSGAANRNDRLIRYYREQLGGDGPFVCEVELSPAGLITRQLGAEVTHPWSNVASASEVPGGIEFLYRPIGALFVRERAFATPEAREQFLALSRRLMSGGGVV